MNALNARLLFVAQERERHIHTCNLGKILRFSLLVPLLVLTYPTHHRRDLVPPSTSHNFLSRYTNGFAISSYLAEACLDACFI